MKKVEITTAPELTSPNPVTLVCTETPEKGANLAAVSWWTFLAFTPPTLCFAMGQKSYSGEMVRKNKRVALVVPGSQIAEATFKCGTVTGRNKNKAKEFGIDLTLVGDCPIQVPVESRLLLDCELTSFQEVADHYLYICSIKDIYADSGKKPVFAWEGYASVRPLPC